MTFRSGRLFESILNAVDVSPFLFSSEFTVNVDTGEVTTAKSAWRSYLSGLAHSQYFGYGYYDPAQTAVRTTLQAATGVLSFAPAGATTIGDPVRLMSFNSAAYKESPAVKNPIQYTWQADTTSPVGYGNSLAPLAVYGVGAGVATTGEPTGLGNGGVQTTTGLIAHLHVTAMTGGDTHLFKLQDATTVGGAYTDIASGGFVNVTAVGAQRIVVPGTIRQFVRLLYTVAGHSATFAVSAART